MIIHRRYNVNHFIKAPEVRLVGEGRNELISTGKALAEAQALGLDLVEVSSNTNPPVCKLIEYKKFLYQQKQKEQKGKVPSTEQKEFRIRPSIGGGDFQVRINRARKFLLKKNPVKITVQFVGREITHVDIGRQKIVEFTKSLADIGHPEGEPSFEPKNKAIWLIIKPN